MRKTDSGGNRAIRPLSEGISEAIWSKSDAGLTSETIGAQWKPLKRVQAELTRRRIAVHQSPITHYAPFLSLRFYCGRVGRGRGVGRGLGVGVGLSVAVAVGVGVPDGQVPLTLNTMCMFGSPRVAKFVGLENPQADALQ